MSNPLAGRQVVAQGVIKAEQSDGIALEVDFTMVMAGETIRERNARPPEPLADGLRSVEFAYRPLGKRGVIFQGTDASKRMECRSGGMPGCQAQWTPLLAVLLKIVSSGSHALKSMQ